MSQQNLTHPDPEQIVRYVNGRLSGDESRFMGEHLGECRECCQQIEELGASIPHEEVARELSSASESNGVHTQFMEPDAEAPSGEGANTTGECNHVRPAGASSRYQVFEQLAEGGMGSVYRARDLHLERDVALKILGEGRRMDVRLQRFRAEANVLGQLQHPGILRSLIRGGFPGDAHSLR